VGARTGLRRGAVYWVDYFCRDCPIASEPLPNEILVKANDEKKFEQALLEYLRKKERECVGRCPLWRLINTIEKLAEKLTVSQAR
jgi:hypothetical protein